MRARAEKIGRTIMKTAGSGKLPLAVLPTQPLTQVPDRKCGKGPERLVVLPIRGSQGSGEHLKRDRGRGTVPDDPGTGAPFGRPPQISQGPLDHRIRSRGAAIAKLVPVSKAIRPSTVSSGGGVPSRMLPATRPPTGSTSRLGSPAQGWPLESGRRRNRACERGIEHGQVDNLCPRPQPQAWRFVLGRDKSCSARDEPRGADRVEDVTGTLRERRSAWRTLIVS
jgi:hypothetical protein